MTNFVKSIAIAMVMSAVVFNANAQNVVENANGTVTYTYADGSSKTFQAKRLSELTSAERQQIISGEKAAYDLSTVGLDGKNRKRTLISLQGGAHYTNGNFAPMVSAGVSYDVIPNLALIGQGEFSTNKYGEYADAEGSYPVWGIFAGGEWYPVLSDKAKYTGEGSRFGIGLLGGYLSGKTNDLSMEKSVGSEGQGAALKLYLKGQIQLSGRLYGVIEGGFRWGPHFETDAEGNWSQKFLDKGAGGYAQLGIAVKL